MVGESAPAGAAAADDFESIEKAVMESKRGRWFLDEYVKRRGGGDSKILLAAMGKLENTVAAGDALIAERLSKALGLMTSLDSKLSSTPGVAAPAVALAPQHMKFFKQDEELFEAPAKPQVAEIRSITETRTEITKGAKLVIRPAQAEGPSETVSIVKESPPPTTTEAPPKSRIVIIRHNTSDTLNVPLHEEFRASA